MTLKRFDSERLRKDIVVSSSPVDDDDGSVREVESAGVSRMAKVTGVVTPQHRSLSVAILPISSITRILYG